MRLILILLRVKLLRLSDMPGFTATAVFKPGNDLGETALTVKTVDEDPLVILFKPIIMVLNQPVMRDYCLPLK